MTTQHHTTHATPAWRYYAIIPHYGVYVMCYLRQLYKDAGLSREAANIAMAIRMTGEAAGFDYEVDLNATALQQYKDCLEWKQIDGQMIEFFCTDAYLVDQCEEIIEYLYK